MIELNELIQGCKHFKWKEFLYCPQWGVHAFPDDDTALNLIQIAQVMDKIRELLGGESIRVTSGWRPRQYNIFIGGSSDSYHIKGMACDFQHAYLLAHQVSERLLPHLEELGIRMENHDGNWTHIDLGEVKSKRFFKP